MCGKIKHEVTFGNILSDPLVRLVMASDGVSDAELRMILASARRAVASRRPTSEAANRRGTAELHAGSDDRPLMFSVPG